MRARIEKIEDDRTEEVVVYCRRITPEIESLIEKLNQKDSSRPVPSFFKGDEQYYLSLREILFFETDKDKVYAHTADNSYEVKLRLYELEAVLPDYFVRSSKSTIVSILHIFSIQKGLTRVCQITFRHTHKEVFGSRVYSNELYRKLNERYLYENR